MNQNKNMADFNSWFKGLSPRRKVNFILITLFATFIITIGFCMSSDADKKADSPKALTAKELVAQRIQRAKDHWPQISEDVKRRCRHPLTAEISYLDAQFVPLDTTAENVAIQGTGTAKNSFGVPDEFTYTAYLAINLDGHDSIWYFNVK